MIREGIVETIWIPIYWSILLRKYILSLCNSVTMDYIFYIRILSSLLVLSHLILACLQVTVSKSRVYLKCWMEELLGKNINHKETYHQ